MTFAFDPHSLQILCFGMIETEVGKRDVELLLDTGCTRTTIRTSILIDMGAKRVEGPLIPVTTGSGESWGVPYVLHDFQALGRATGPKTVLGMDLPDDIRQHGIIGMDFLADLKITIDFPNGTIKILKPTVKRTTKRKR